MSGSTMASGGEAAGVRRARERAWAGPPAMYRHEAWEAELPGLACGITAAGPETDYGLGTRTRVGRFLDRYRALAHGLGFSVVAVPRQVHGARVLRLRLPAGAVDGGAGAVEPGSADPAGAAVLVAGRADGLVTATRGILLVVTAADCVPVHVAAPAAEALALLHAGWRGIATGVLEAGLDRLRALGGVRAADLRVHLGPAICGECYEVGPEVPAALGLPQAPHVDLRATLAQRALAAGIPETSISASTWCTRCDLDRFHSHRGRGHEAGRMAAFLGLRVGPSGSAG